MNDLDERDDLDTVMEQALRERIGGEAPPDLVDAVRARLHSTPAVERSHRWLTAAAVLLGCSVVAGVAWWRHRSPVIATQSAAGNSAAAVDPDRSPMVATEPKAERSPAHADEPRTIPEASAEERQDPVGPRRIVTAEQAAALPPTTRAVEVVGGSDETIEALVHLQDLETLTVSQPWNEVSGTAPKTAPMPKAEFLTNAVWQHFAKFTKLRRLELNATRLVVADTGLHGVDVVTALERLPGLESLAMRHVVIAPAVLQRLPSLGQLRELELVCDRGFSDAGIAALAKCRSLRRLSLRGSFDLPSSRLLALADLREIEVLDLSASEPAAEVPPAAGNVGEVERLAGLLRQAMERRRSSGPDSLWSTVHDDVLAALSKMPKLRQVSLLGCERVTDAGIRELVAMPSLRVLDMRQLSAVTSDVVDVLAGARQLEEVDLRNCPAITAEHLATLRGKRPDLRIVETAR